MVCRRMLDDRAGGCAVDRDETAEDRALVFDWDGVGGWAWRSGVAVDQIIFPSADAGLPKFSLRGLDTRPHVVLP